MASDDSRDPIDDVQSSQYTPLEFIGKGGCGSVFKAQHKIDQQIYAIKQIISNTDDEWMRNCREAKIHAELYHKNIVRYQTSWRSIINIFLDSTTSDDSSSPRKMDISSGVENLWGGFGESSTGEGSPMEVDPQSDEAKSRRLARQHLADVWRQSAMRRQVPMGQAGVLAQPEEVLGQPRPSQRFLYIAMEYCPKNLIDVLVEKVEAEAHLKNPDDYWTWVANIIRSVANAIGFIHKNRYFHRDLKPENILFDSKGVVKIGDFGLSKNICKPPPPEGVEEINHSEGVGTDAYLSPEQSDKKPYNHMVDIYQLGLIMFHMIKPDSIKERLELPDIKAGKIPHTQAPKSLNDLFSKMVSQDANKRPDAKSVSSDCSQFLKEFPKEFPKDKKKKIEKQ